VTGGTGALGGAVTARLLAAGHRVAATWVTKEEAEALRDTIGTTEALLLVEMDATDPGSIGTALDDVRAGFGPVEALVHLVGAWKGGEPVHELSLATWERMVALNLTSAVLCSRALLPEMRDLGWGRMVFVSSRTARRDRAGQVAYAIAKSGLGVLAETIAEESRGLDITANVVAPSILDTPANRAAMPGVGSDRLVPPGDVAASISFLVSQEAGRLRGGWLPVYGAA
jgi:NAD(P)-dependent dehydrogenase (short-subunit alcohol dehydrogenase family)